MKIRIFILFVFLVVISCKTNQKINKVRQGYWVESYKLGEDTYKSTGWYKNGNPVKKWKYLKNDTIYQKEKYIKSICKTIYYHKNGKIMQRGQSKTEVKDSLVHWFYFGEWFYYDKFGKLIQTKKYENGLEVEQIKPIIK